MSEEKHWHLQIQQMSLEEVQRVKATLFPSLSRSHTKVCPRFPQSNQPESHSSPPALSHQAFSVSSCSSWDSSSRLSIPTSSKECHGTPAQELFDFLLFLVAETQASFITLTPESSRVPHKSWVLSLTRPGQFHPTVRHLTQSDFSMPWGPLKVMRSYTACHWMIVMLTS